jgi:hypothetical protein
LPDVKHGACAVKVPADAPCAPPSERHAHKSARMVKLSMPRLNVGVQCLVLGICKRRQEGGRLGALLGHREIIHGRDKNPCRIKRPPPSRELQGRANSKRRPNAKQEVLDLVAVAHLTPVVLCAAPGKPRWQPLASRPAPAHSPPPPPPAAPRARAQQQSLRLLVALLFCTAERSFCNGIGSQARMQQVAIAPDPVQQVAARSAASVCRRGQGHPLHTQ